MMYSRFFDGRGRSCERWSLYWTSVDAQRASKQVFKKCRARRCLMGNNQTSMHLSPRTHLKSPVARAIIWNKELDSLTLYKESNHHYRATRSGGGGLVGVLGTPSFVPGLFLRHAAGAFRQKANPPPRSWLCLGSHFSLGSSSQEASVAAQLIRHFS
jgi:hypothetical protein